MNDSLLIIAGEASGDLHGSALIKELIRFKPDINVFGIGGKNMKDAGLNAVYDIEKLAFLGFTEVIKHIPFIKKVQKDIIDKVLFLNTKTAVLIDYPGFNLSIAKKLKKLGLKIIYYISPQIWAWGKGRISKIKKLVDHMIVLFPFEKELYQKEGVKVTFSGHPLIERIKNYNFIEAEEFRKKYGILKDILLIMPGSRHHEIELILPECVKAARYLSDKYDLQPVIACSGNISEDIFRGKPELEDFKIIKGFTYELLKYSRLGIIKSGTSTLEAGLFCLPYVVVYKTSRLTYEIGRVLIKIKNIAIVNIILQKNVIKELIQNDVESGKISEECSKILDDVNYYNRLKNDLAALEKLLGNKNASEEAAKIIIEEMKNV